MNQKKHVQHQIAQNVHLTGKDVTLVQRINLKNIIDLQNLLTVLKKHQNLQIVNNK